MQWHRGAHSGHRQVLRSARQVLVTESSRPYPQCKPPPIPLLFLLNSLVPTADEAVPQKLSSLDPRFSGPNLASSHQFATCHRWWLHSPDLDASFCTFPASLLHVLSTPSPSPSFPQSVSPCLRRCPALSHRPRRGHSLLTPNTVSRQPGTN
jgi:hypothetical protein